MSYGRRLEQAMNAVGMSAAELAKELDISPQAVHSVLKGSTKAFNAENHTRASIALRCDALWLATGIEREPATESRVMERAVSFASNAEPAGRPRMARPVPVLGVAKLGNDGYYEELTTADGFVDGYSTDPDAYALLVKGDSMYPAIRHGFLVIVEPNGRCVPGEFVAIALHDGLKMVKELVIQRTGEIMVESVNGNHRRTIDRSEIAVLHPVTAVVSPSKWRSF